MKDATPELRWSWVEVERAAIRKNTRAFRQIIKPTAAMMCVVKADAYGHGAAECARIMRAAGADQFAVATVGEGVALRESGVEAPILVLSEPPISSIETLLKYDIMPSVYTMEFAMAYGEIASSLGVVGRYHLALDTGMTRIGVWWQDALDFARSIDFHRGIERAGIFTHFATADVLNDWDWALQHKRFCDAVDAIRNAGLETGLVHCDNTPASILHSDTKYDMVRVGIGLYGLQPAETTRPRITLYPAMSVRARITRVATPSVGAGVSYGMTYRVPKPNVQIATIPIGYADGLSRTLSNRMEVLCRGQRMRQVGNICMDQCMFAVDVNTARGVNPARPVAHGDLVTIMGHDGDNAITAEDIAQLMGTINYQVVCDFGLRLEKVYV
jgi:alanine racemase